MTPTHVDAAEDQIAACDIVLTQFEVPPQTVARAMVLGRIPEREDVVCTNCKTYVRMKEHDDWLTMRDVQLIRFLNRARRRLLFGSRYYTALHDAAMRWVG
jgi:hypothetical protein